jgi:hypothetical protein
MNRNNGGPVASADAPEACENAAYTFFFPNGLADTANYQVSVNGPDGLAVTDILSGPRYQCGPYTGELGNIDTECSTINGGEFYMWQ